MTNSLRPTSDQIPGYDYGSARLSRSPISLEELSLLKQTLLFDTNDEAALRKAGEVIDDQIDAILDVWYGFVGAHPHLSTYFSNTEKGGLDAQYLARVRARFGQWIRDTTAARFDQTWLDYQHEIGRRHHRPHKNQTDGVKSVDHIHYRYIIAFVIPLSVTMKPFLAKKGHSAAEVETMHAAWTKAVVLTALLWTYPYVTAGSF